MNSKSKSNGNNIIVRTFVAIILIAVFIPIVAVAGEREKHNPYTVLGMQIRSHLLPDTPGARGEDLGPLVFQEIVPCRFVSTLENDAYPDPWGGKEFQIMETRTYFPKGVLVSSDGWENPCSETVPSDAIGLAVRLMSYEAPGEGSVYLAPASTRTQNIPAMWFAGGKDEMREATVVLRNDGFALMVDQTTHLTIDVIGYFLKDPKGSGPKGDKGEKGDQGDRGEAGAQGYQGVQGEKGDKGDQGEAGAQGLKGDKGDQGEAGAQGLKGDKGDQGEAGAQGLKGDKGDQGEAGAQGLKGDKGDNGEAGAQGLKGDKGDQGEAGAQGLKGDKGDQGEAGAQGLKGDKGDQGEAGAQGLKGDKGDQGEAGAQGLKGDKGDKGDNGDAGAQGAQGPAGPMGPQGPEGPQGPKGDAGIIANSGGPYTFPPGGTITIHDSDVKANSFIVLMYVNVSNGNALGVASVSNGSFVATGSPNKPFKYLILTVQ